MTKYMGLEGGSIRPGERYDIDSFSFEEVDFFRYCGSSIKRSGSIKEEIRERIAVVSQCYFALQPTLWSSLSEQGKQKSRYLRPVVLCGSET